MLEQRVSREARTWAEQRAALVKERSELQTQLEQLHLLLEEKEEQLWKLMSGEVLTSSGTGAGEAQAGAVKRRTAKDRAVAAVPARAVKGSGKHPIGGAKAGAGAGARSGAGAAAVSKSAIGYRSKASSGAGLPDLGVAMLEVGAEAVVTEEALAAAKQAEVLAAANAALAAAEKEKLAAAPLTDAILVSVSATAATSSLECRALQSVLGSPIVANMFEPALGMRGGGSSSATLHAMWLTERHSKCRASHRSGTGSGPSGYLRSLTSAVPWCAHRENRSSQRRAKRPPRASSRQPIMQMRPSSWSCNQRSSRSRWEAALFSRPRPTRMARAVL